MSWREEQSRQKEKRTEMNTKKSPWGRTQKDRPSVLHGDTIKPLTFCPGVYNYNRFTGITESLDQGIKIKALRLRH